MLLWQGWLNPLTGWLSKACAIETSGLKLLVTKLLQLALKASPLFWPTSCSCSEGSSRCLLSSSRIYIKVVDCCYRNHLYIITNLPHSFLNHATNWILLPKMTSARFSNEIFSYSHHWYWGVPGARHTWGPYGYDSRASQTWDTLAANDVSIHIEKEGGRLKSTRSTQVVWWFLSEITYMPLSEYDQALF